MNETAAEPAARPLVNLAPLPLAVLSEAVRNLLGGTGQTKLMAAKGIAPVRPAELAIAIYQLSFDDDADVKAAADVAPGLLPDKILVPALNEPLPPPVLHFFAQRLLVTRIDALEKVLYNPATADETFLALASRLDERELEVIFQNEERLLRSPTIVHALYFNERSRMSSLNRAIELCARNGVRVDGIPAFDEVARAIFEDPNAKSREADKQFKSVLDVTAAIDPNAVEEDAKSTRKSPVIDFTKLKLYEKIRLATLGNAYCRQNLIRDPNRMVAMAVIRSPLITETEIVRAAGNRNVCEDVIRYVANQREYTKIYAVKLSLVQNPKCPIAFSLRFLTVLHAEDIKRLSRSKNVPSALAIAARKLVQTRGIGG